MLVTKKKIYKPSLCRMDLYANFGTDLAGGVKYPVKLFWSFGSSIRGYDTNNVSSSRSSSKSSSRNQLFPASNIQIFILLLSDRKHQIYDFIICQSFFDASPGEENNLVFIIFCR